jgi:hypothetical protein
VLKSRTNGTKINGKKKKNIPNLSKTSEIITDATAAMIVSGQPDQCIILSGHNQIIF